MNGLERRTQEQGGLVVARRPSAFAIDALPGDLELCVNQDDRLRTTTARTDRAMPIEDLGNHKASLHNRLVGRSKDAR